MTDARVGPFELFDVRAGEVKRERREPGDYGLDACAPADLAGGDAAHNARVLQRVLAGEERGAARDALLLGAALALEVSGVEAAPRLAITRAAEAIDSGAAIALLGKLVQFHAIGRSTGGAA